ncbi:hypothetical protein Sps_00457 [Shewanella psychrophila]|uniref:Uncharacterized protein n=1 Tax=Shewanella psychrophila TaxID=225848 RepID=A0A1S6HJG1_9GAMM|nr:hypothetical protein Sps_00457 [Shewanella psychrophila]
MIKIMSMTLNDFLNNTEPLRNSKVFSVPNYAVSSNINQYKKVVNSEFFDCIIQDE